MKFNFGYRGISNLCLDVILYGLFKKMFNNLVSTCCMSLKTVKPPYCATYLNLDNTLYNVILRIARNLLETRENIKIKSHPFYHIIWDWFSWGWSKKNQNGGLKKTEIFNSPNSQYFFSKISWIGPWVSKIDWCKGNWFFLLHPHENQSQIMW